MSRRLALTLATLVACTSTDREPSGPRADAGLRADVGPGVDAGGLDAGAPDGSTTPERCADGSARTRVSLTPLSPLPALGTIDLPHLLPNTIVVGAETEGAHRVRLDACVSAGGAARLEGLQAMESALDTPRRYVVDPAARTQTETFIDTPAGQLYEVRVPPADLRVEGLEAALAGDLRALRVRVLGPSGLLLVGHAGFVAVARGEVSAVDITYTSLTVVVGGLAIGDTFAGLACKFGHTPLSARFRLGTAQFEVGGCSFLGGGHTMGYEFHRLTIEDSSTTLTPADRRKHEFTTKAEVDAVLNYRWNHHNACDSFHLALPHADYAASSAPLAGCGTQVPNAPPRSFDEPFDAPARYRIRYYGGAWVDADAVGCSQYMSCM
jgi:hypothetical protein